MKKVKFYIIGSVALVSLCLLLFINNRHHPTLDERISLRRYDKIPYGTYVAQQLLPGLFPHAEIVSSSHTQGLYADPSSKKQGEAVIFISRYFNASTHELDKLLAYAKKGNYVFIIAKSLSLPANRFFRCMDNNTSLNEYYGIPDDSLQLQLDQPPFTYSFNYIYPGKRYENYFSAIDTPATTVLGHTTDHRVNFIQLHTGKGRIYIHLAPLAFSNYFILHKRNIQYFQTALSVIPEGVSKVTWNEYYLDKSTKNNATNPGLFGVLFQYPSFEWALLTTILFILLYVVLEMRRKQRVITPVVSPVNESLQFVKTMGRMYYDKGDHRNLAKKMSVHFLDHVRSRYHLSTTILDDNFIQQLSGKSGFSLSSLQYLVHVIVHIEDIQMTEHQLFRFHNQLQTFYQTT